MNQNDIQGVYDSLGYKAGWWFITCPEQNKANAKLLLITLNPAGNREHGPKWSQELGSAYQVENWGDYAKGLAPLQRQIQLLCTMLGLQDREVFSAHFIPFRSPNWKTLERKVEAKAFSIKLWAWLIPQVSFDRVVCVGKGVPAIEIAHLLNANFEVSLPVGWGDIDADRYRLPDGRPLIALPHLSRFAVFGREASQSALQALFEI